MEGREGSRKQLLAEGGSGGGRGGSWAAPPLRGRSGVLSVWQEVTV